MSKMMNERQGMEKVDSLYYSIFCMSSVLKEHLLSCSG